MGRLGGIEVAIMSFMPQLREYLNQTGMIYTVRKYKMVGAIVNIEGVGRCQRALIGSIQNKVDLEPYYLNSGFSTKEDWWKRIKYFIPGLGAPKYLYKIVKIGGEDAK